MVKRTVRVKNRKLEIRAPASMPDGTVVRVELEVVKPTANGKVKRKKTAADEEYPLSWMGRHAIDTGIPDLAEEHDHYIYGTPKRPA